ncbi:MAG: hypothetical protein GX793_02930 [Bacteroidales bacterium]|nr:hypothetical protein [Bacteroidales bacterium]
MKKKYYILIIVSIILLGFLLFYIFCKKKKEFEVDISKINLNIEIERFDKDFENIPKGDFYSQVEFMENRYEEFFEIYNYDIIAIVGSDNSAYLSYVNTFLNDFSVVQARKHVDKEFANMDDITEDLTYGFKHLLYYYPNAYIPRIVSFIAGFNQSVVLTDNYIGIGLDKYLGKDCELYDMLEIPEFSKIEMSREQIALDVLAAWVEAEYPFYSDSENLLDNMIYNGRKLYFLYSMFPNFEPERINKYTKEQMDFCEKFEREMWTSIIENKLLFSSDALTIKKFVGSAPFTYQFGQDSPPRTGNWLGFRIVHSYMKNNDIELDELMEELDFQKILNLSKYNPKYN